MKWENFWPICGTISLSRWILLNGVSYTFNTYLSNLELLRSTLFQDPSQAQIHTVFCRVLDWLSLIPSELMADIIIWRLEMFQKINLDRTVRKESFGPQSFTIWYRKTIEGTGETACFVIFINHYFVWWIKTSSMNCLAITIIVWILSEWDKLNMASPLYCCLFRRYDNYWCNITIKYNIHTVLHHKSNVLNRPAK
jgi:hypothetical protein